MEDKRTPMDWQQVLYDDYMIFRKRSASCAQSTEATIRATIFSFFDYMNRCGIKSLSDVSAVDLKNWHIQSRHSSARARNVYTSQLRIFFEYLADKGFVSPNLPLALTRQCSSRTSIVEVLTPEQIKRFDEYRTSASTPMELRDIAIVLLGFRMGMRSIDICKLMISDISWRDQTISFVQQKTGVFITLPMPTDVGNSLYRYITEGRPCAQESNRIFLSHVPPHHGLQKSSAASRSLQRIFANSRISAPKGFHITRRTFASNMLRSGNAIPLIASALGHAGIQSVDPYLSTDDANLKLCAISCEKITYKGKYNL